MDPAGRFRYVMASLVVAGLAAAAVVGVSCRPLPHDGVEVTRNECVSCHRSEYESVREPLHLGTLPETCGDCHQEDHWSPANGFDHDKRFELHGAHTKVACNACHTKGYDSGDTPNTCVDCHRDDYDQAKDPSHTNYDTKCLSCHDETAWRPAPSFDHDWPLTGAHARTLCASCHMGDPPVYEGTSKACVSCHQKDYDTSPFPGHSAFATTCQDCHSTSDWSSATFDHAWPLTGKHKTARCESCHVGNPPVYAGTKQQCVSCHQKDYDTSPFPGHSTFGTSCQNCHATSGWTPASGGHPESRFPITREPHSKVSCAGCHNSSLDLNPRDNIDCIGCHTGEHARTKMDEKHREVSKYPSGAAPPDFCLSCHADGGDAND